MKATELRSLTIEELEARVNDLRDALFNVQIKHATGQLENMTSVKTARRDLARALTVRAERRKASA